MKPEKLCATCGRRITWRKKWEGHWDQLRHCSQRCRRHRPGPQDERLEALILEQLQRAPQVGEAWLMEQLGPQAQRERERVRSAARRLVGRGLARLPRGQDPSTARGPLLLLRP